MTVMNHANRENNLNRVGKYSVKSLYVSLLVTLFLCTIAFAEDNPPTSSDVATGVLAGQFMVNKSSPLANGRLFLYDKSKGSPSSEKYIRVPDHIFNLDVNGKFSMVLPPGTYFLSAIMSPADGSVGPPVDGQLIYFRMDDQGVIQGYTVTAGKTTDAGIVSSALPYSRNQDSQDKNSTMVVGTVKDADGVPVEGAVILAYMDPTIQGKALYVSAKTAKDGKFMLRFNDGGNYFLRVRGDYGGGTPKEGEIVNIKDPKETLSISLKKGERLSGIEIQTTRQTRGPLYKGDQP